MENLPFPDVQEMGGSSLSPLWWFYAVGLPELTYGEGVVAYFAIRK